MADDALQVIGSAVEIVAESLARAAHEHGYGTMAEVTIDDEYLLLLDGERHGDVGCQVTLARAWVERRKDDDVLLRMGTYHELQVSAQHAERLVHDVALACLHHNLSRLLRLLPELDALQKSWSVLATDAVWYLTEEWYGDVLEVVSAPHRRVHVLTDKDDYHRYQESENESHEDDVAAHRLHGLDVARRRGDDARVVGGESLGKLVFLSLLQEEEVERLLHLLLATHCLQVLCLARVAGYLAGGLRLVCLQVAKLRVECHHEVVDTGYDTMAHGGEALVIVSHQWVLLAGVSHQVVALQLLLVVFGNLLLDARAVDADIGWQELVLAHLASQEVAQVACHGEA